MTLSFGPTIISCIAKCPQLEDITPCTCDEKLGSISCIGSAIADHELGLIGSNIKSGSDSRFSSLTIQNTAITQLDNNTYIDANFDEIIIENNTQLISINNQSFKKGFVKNLYIRNNPKLNDSIFSLLKYLKISDEIRFDGNDMKEIPSDAFDSDAKSITLDHNRIERIHSNAFSSLPYLTHLSIDHNLIDSIEKNGLNFSVNNFRSMIVSLNNNKLTANSFSTHSLPKLKEISVSLHLENNHLTEFPEDVFRNFVEENQHKIYLNGNMFDCDCNIKWIIDKPQSNHVFSVYCDDKQKSVFSMKSEEFICKETEKTTETIFSKSTKPLEPSPPAEKITRAEPLLV